MLAADDQLTNWIADLRRRLANGDLAGLSPVELGHGTARLPADVMISTMLADYQDLNSPEGSLARNPSWHAARCRSLLRDFQRLRELIG